jgi:hypothetical protein
MNEENYKKGFEIKDPSVFKKNEDPEKEFQMIFEKESFEFEVEKVNKAYEFPKYMIWVYLILAFLVYFFISYIINI